VRRVSGGYALCAFGAVYRSVVLGKVYCSFDYPVVIHFDKIAFADFLVLGDIAFAMGAAYRQDMAAPDFFAIWIFVYLHTFTMLHKLSDGCIIQEILQEFNVLLLALNRFLC